MTTSIVPEPRAAFVALSRGAGRVRHAMAKLDAEAGGLVVALRRGIPFLSRGNIPISVVAARALDAAALRAGVGSSSASLVVDLATDPGGARGMMVIDAPAATLLLDGLLGGSGRDLPAPGATGLTAAQRTPLQRATTAFLSEISATFERTLGLRLLPLPSSTAPVAGTHIAIALTLDHPAGVGTITLAISADALASSVSPVSGAACADEGLVPDARVAFALGDAPLVLVAELGRIRLPLRRLLALRVGDTLALHVPVGGAVKLCAEDATLFEGVPTTLGGQIAIRLADRHES